MTSHFNNRIASLLNSTALSRPLALLGTMSALVASGSAQAFDMNSLPQGGTVTGGAATIATSGNTLTVQQSSNRAIIDWRSFNIGSNAQANFQQPGTSSIAVNRVNASTDPSRIDGGLHANGQVWILNPNGVLFGKTARVDAAGVVATTANINDKAFMAGSNKLQMTGGDSGQVVNEGQISVGQGGLAAFVAPSVRNSGIIRARVGKVTLAAGDTYTLDLAGDRLVELGLGAGHAVVDQSGKVVNPGGVIDITAKAAGQVVDSVINISGVTSASSVKTAGGRIILGGDTINVASTAKTSADGVSGGQIIAVANKTGNYAGSYSAQGTTGDGGHIETSGKTVTVASNATINASSAHGKAGTWTVDPVDVTITGGANNGTVTGGTVTTGTIEATLNNGTGVSITTDQTGTDHGDLTLASSINATSTGNAGLTLTGRHLSATGGSTVNIAGGALTLNVNQVNAATNPSGSWISDALKMIGTVSGGSTVSLGAGTYAVPSGGGNYLDIVTANTRLEGAGQGSTIIDASAASTYGLRVQADGVELNDFTLKGPTSSGSYGIKVEPLENTILPTDRVHGFTIINVAETGSYKNGLDLNGVLAATIDRVTVSNTTHGTGIAITDSANVGITNSTTTNNAWGGLALYQHNATYNQQVDQISVDNTNTFHESNPVYMEDQSASLNFGSVNIQGFDHAVKATVAPNDSYTWLQNGEQTAINFALAAAPTKASIQGWTGTGGDNNFVVASGLKIQSALDAAGSNATVNVHSGTYAETLNIAKAGLTLQGAAGAIIDAGGAADAIDISSTAGNLGTITINELVVQNWTSGGIIQSMAAGPFATVHVTNNIVYGPAAGATSHGNGIEVTGDNSIVSGNQIYGVHLNSPDWSGSDIIVANGSHIAVTNNVIDGDDTGIAVTNWNNTAGMSDITISGNTVSNVGEGISIQTYEGEYFGTPSGPISGVSITGNTLSGNQNGIGVWDYSTAHNADWASTITAISGNTFTNNADQISTDFAGANVNALVGTNTFDRTVVNAAGGNTIHGDLQTAINEEVAGSTLNLAGTFAAGANINQAGDTLDGQGATLITAVNNGDNGLTISANNVTVKNLEIAGPAADINYAWGSAITRGIVVNSGVTNFAITGNNIHGTRNDILVNGLNSTGSITGNIIAASKSGVSVQYTDGSGIDISGNTDGGNVNEWGMNLHLNGHYDDLNVYHPTNDKIAADADPVAQAVIVGLSSGNDGWTVQDQGYTNSNRTAVTVSTTGSDANQGSGLNSLATIAAGVNAVVTGGTVNVKDGSYTLSGELDIAKGLTLKGESQAGTVLTSNSTGYGIYVTGDGVSLSNFTYNAPTAVGGGTYGIKVEPGTNVASDRVTGFGIDHVTINGGYRTALDLNGIDGATIDNVSVSGVIHGNGIALTDSANVTITNTTTSNDAWGGLALYQTNIYYDQQVNNISVDGTNTFNEAIPVYAENQSSTNDFGSITLAGFNYVVKSPNDPTDVYTWFQKTQTGAVNFATDASLSNGNVNLPTATVQGYGGSGIAGNNTFTVGVGANGTAMSVNVALDQAAAGGIVDVLSGTYAEDVALTAPVTVNFDNVTLNNLAITQTGSGSTLSGSVNTASVTGFAINLGGDLSLDTSSANGTIDLGSVDGGHALTLNAGSDGAVLVGSLGATTRLGAVNITADATFLGETNKAASFDINGDVVLSAPSTLVDTTVSSTSAGDITFGGDIYGLTDGSQSLVLSAGPGTGNKSANGDIAMNNAGISTVRLGSFTVSGDDFTALTVDLKGDFASTLTGNQVFAADTLNAGGNVNSQVGGNATGHIVAGGNVAIGAGGNVSGTISGNDVSLTAGQTVSGTITGQTVNLIGQTVNTQVNAKTLNVNAQNGTITGTFTPGTVSNGLSLNGQLTGASTGINTGTGTGTGTGTNPGSGSSGQLYINGQQLVVENFVLPVGAQIGANGALILPPGTVIGLLSPGGGPARVILVSDVGTLGQLLSEGYVAFVIDLKSKKKAPVQVALNN